MTTLRSYLEENYSSKSIYHYEDQIMKYLNYINSDGIQENQLDILKYIGHLRKQKLHPKTIRNHLFSIKIYYNYLQKSGLRIDHPCKTLTLKDQINRSIELESLYTYEQMEQFLNEHRSKQKYLQRRDEIIISLLIHQALTNTEIISLEIKDVDLEEGQVHINNDQKSEQAKKSKKTPPKSRAGNQSRTLALKPKQILLIDRYLNQDRPELIKRNRESNNYQRHSLLLTKYGKPISPAAVNRQINQGEKKFMKMTPLKIRQSVIYHKLKQGHNVRLVQAFAGHRSILSTESYQTSKLAELKLGIKKFHPLQ